MGYRKINNLEEVVSFIENAKLIIRNRKYEVHDEINSNLDLVKDI
jgi:hypothetical protein